MNPMSPERAHTSPHQPDGTPLACALQIACYLAGQNSLSRVVLWVGDPGDVKTVLATAISQSVLEPLLRVGTVACDGFIFELRADQSTNELGDAILLAICVEPTELERFLRLANANAIIFVPHSEEDLGVYLDEIPDSAAIGWTEEAPEPDRGSGRTEEMSRRIAWYDERYQIASAGSLGSESGHKYATHDGTGQCRYCGKTVPEVTFRSKSHAFPEQIGNKTLIDPAECDECNRHFAKMLDDELAKWTQPWRSVLRVKGKSGIPTTKSRDQKLRIEAADALNLKLFTAADDERRVVDVDGKTLRILVDRPAYTPMGVFKCLVKMALSVMPETYASECDHLKKWILETSHTFESYPYRPLNVLLQVIPGPTWSGVISYSLVRRKNEVDGVPYMMFVLQFANILLQITLPMHERDEAILNGDPFELLPFPHLGGLKDVESQFGRSELRVLDMSGIERVKGESELIPLRYERRIELPEDSQRHS